MDLLAGYGSDGEEEEEQVTTPASAPAPAPAKSSLLSFLPPPKTDAITKKSSFLASLTSKDKSTTNAATGKKVIGFTVPIDKDVLKDNYKDEYTKEPAAKAPEPGASGRIPFSALLPAPKNLKRTASETNAPESIKKLKMDEEFHDESTEQDTEGIDKLENDEGEEQEEGGFNPEKLNEDEDDDATLFPFDNPNEEAEKAEKSEPTPTRSQAPQQSHKTQATPTTTTTTTKKNPSSDGKGKPAPMPVRKALLGNAALRQLERVRLQQQSQASQQPEQQTQHYQPQQPQQVPSYPQDYSHYSYVSSNSSPPNTILINLYREPSQFTTPALPSSREVRTSIK